ncbi:hypothetical protein ABTZ03_09255 [Kitasatospora sp. NPDC096077]|uniref:hypothetical protein n=1 Tax=Kitasatospora sp. NPDC096077 TaxID=3155544 RepID=UPI00331AA5B9
MKKMLAAVAMTGVLTLAALAGTATTASASDSFPGPIGAFSTSTDCSNYVAAAGKWGAWDCEQVGGAYPGWYAITGLSNGYGPYTSSTGCGNYVAAAGRLGVWDCEYVGGAYPGWYIFIP